MPTTEAGKAISSRNATKHAILSETIVLPEVENAEDWDAHHRGVVADLQPEGTIEIEVAGRIAFTLWRLRRAMRAEQATLRAAQRKAGAALASDYRAVEWNLPAQPEEIREHAGSC